jgi:3-phosphoshikimate 1-carboxyvinyltransferase
MELVSRASGRLEGRLRAPADKSISHRALMLAALGAGRATVSPISHNEDNVATLEVLRALGVPIRVHADEDMVEVTGVEHPCHFEKPRDALDFRNSGTGFRLMAGLLASGSHDFMLTGDASLRGRPMSRLLPLREMGAQIDGEWRDGRLYPPLTISGRRLKGCTFELPMASAQVKSALLLAGLYADGATAVREPHLSRDHTERMLQDLGVDLRRDEQGWIRVEPVRTPWRGRNFEAAPDPSSASFLVAAAALTQSSDVIIESSVNPTRTGFFDALAAMGVELRQDPMPPCGAEPMAALRVRSGGSRKGIEISGELTVRALDELPLLAGIAAVSSGVTRIRDAAELRVKESDRIVSTARMLRSLGAKVDEHPDGLEIQGGVISGGLVESFGDHRIAMTAAVLGLVAEGDVRVREAECIGVSYPDFVAHINSLGGHVETF